MPQISLIYPFQKNVCPEALTSQANNGLPGLQAVLAWQTPQKTDEGEGGENKMHIRAASLRVSHGNTPCEIFLKRQDIWLATLKTYWCLWEACLYFRNIGKGHSAID